jgi:hypothetical protein
LRQAIKILPERISAALIQDFGFLRTAGGKTAQVLQMKRAISRSAIIPVRILIVPETLTFIMWKVSGNYEIAKNYFCLIGDGFIFFNELNHLINA